MKKKLIKLLLIGFALLYTAWGAAQPKVIAHRGFWKAEGAAQNSLTSLNKAAEATIYGTEFDVRITEDGILIVNHDDSIQGYTIETTVYAALKDIQLINGETLPTLEQYLAEGKKNRHIQLVLEIKPQQIESNNRRIAEAVVEMVNSMEVQSQVEYISFSLPICMELKRIAPNATLAYLNGNLSPQELKELGFTGLDYHASIFKAHPEWIQEAHDLGLTVNVWTVNDPEFMQQFIRQEVDFITTDNPLELKALISVR